MRKALIATLVLAVLAVAGLAAACHQGEEGYFSPQFTPDGSAVVVVVRDARALVLGLGYDMLTPPAHVRVTRDRFSIARVAVADGRVEALIAVSSLADRRHVDSRPIGRVSTAAPRRSCDGPRQRRSSTRSASPCRASRRARRMSCAARWDAEKAVWIERRALGTGMGRHGRRRNFAIQRRPRSPRRPRRRRHAMCCRHRDQGARQRAADPGDGGMPSRRTQMAMQSPP